MRWKEEHMTRARGYNVECQFGSIGFLLLISLISQIERKPLCGNTWCGHHRFRALEPWLLDGRRRQPTGTVWAHIIRIYDSKWTYLITTACTIAKISRREHVKRWPQESGAIVWATPKATAPGTICTQLRSWRRHWQWYLCNQCSIQSALRIQVIYPLLDKGCSRPGHKSCNNLLCLFWTFSFVVVIVRIGHTRGDRAASIRPIQSNPVVAIGLDELVLASRQCPLRIHFVRTLKVSVAWCYCWT